jgi:hypothetical protein
MKQPVSPEQRQQVIDLRRSHSLADVASMTGLPLGTVKTLVSRSGRFTDNQAHRALFTLPAARPSSQTLPAVPELPPQTRVTGDKEIDAIIWLRAVIDTGIPALIEKAMQAKSKIKTPLADIEKRYLQHLVSANPGNWTVAFMTYGFADLDGLAVHAAQREQLRAEALARFGNGIFAETEAESFCVDTLFGLERSRSTLDFDKDEVATRFKKKHVSFSNDFFATHNLCEPFPAPGASAAASEAMVEFVPGLRSWKRSLFLQASSARWTFPKVASSGSRQPAEHAVLVSNRCACSLSNSLFGWLSISRTGEAASPLLTCCGPLVMFACRARTSGGFLMLASVSSVARHWLCAFKASRRSRSMCSSWLLFCAARVAKLIKMASRVKACVSKMASGRFKSP